MTNYLLTTFVNTEKEQVIHDIGRALVPVSDSVNIKFQYYKDVIIFHFASEIPKQELFDYICGLLYGITDKFIFVELKDKYTISLPHNTLEDFLDLNKDTEQTDLRFDVYVDEDEENDNDFVSLLINNKDFFIKKPSLDQILDKIKSKGIKSLTPFEIDTLDSYSKK